mmetsp:Transcript_19401/g.36545  ORF Transcript_19401/g.36545 Transcript_19401/m.36545 type:complete len:105 (+) Transcript_19401:642-956(+)
MDYYDVKPGKKVGWTLKKLKRPVDKRARDASSEVLRAGHVLRQACEDTIASNIDLVSERIYNLNKVLCSSSSEDCKLANPAAEEICTIVDACATGAAQKLKSEL